MANKRKVWLANNTQIEIVDAADYDALAAELAGCKQQLALAPTYEKMIAHNGSQERRIAALEAALWDVIDISGRYPHPNEPDKLTNARRIAMATAEMPAEWGCSWTTNNGDRCVLPAGHGGNHSL
ncbi:MAG TPA: hypothetical protein VGL45_09840 [Bradyrhizobium sp.]|jgi:hypothetical protein